ncbi:beta-propeller domain-containing protein [Brevibacillus ruminantium]|uniref:Beta-propeller domain-containing protein n=1 Tax=Brevibacillus ruminantium TaxID=2950604 RepID=A0ABY4W9C1_9BACL|nr:beta-propeller domain-containing protein [Brevibacillus ruminantium]USG63777.1 beta-propeller domain-containing protein [Brevibacillus ruminantium]
MKKAIGFLLSGVLILAAALAAEGIFGKKESVVVAEEMPSVYLKQADASSSEEPIPVLGSYQQLKKLMKEYEKKQVIRDGYAVAEKASAPVMAPAASSPQMEAGTTAKTVADQASFSSTNVQVQGVDEADVVKTDGTYLYQATQEEIRIIRAYPADRMELVSRITYDEQRFSPQEIYVDEKRLVVIGHSQPEMVRDSAVKSKRFAPIPSPMMVQALIYDISEKSTPRLTRTLEAAGYYVSSRKIGSSLYLVTNKGLDWYAINNQAEEVPGPLYRDTAQSADYRSVPYSTIRYFPEAIQPQYLIVAGANLDDPKQAISVHTYLGAGENIYASQDHLYVAVTQDTAIEAKPASSSHLPRKPESLPVAEYETQLFRFALKNGTLAYAGKGAVPGRMLNQFSIDEHNKFLRIATTTGEMWRTDEGTSKNNLYVLDSELKLSGKLEGIAPGEKIYSVRFMGDRAYMVTFKQVDPLFVIDVKDPSSPKILGALKIPGYSDYLHPYDENHVIGFGKDAVADKDMAFYQGMKLALFDVSDVSNPVEKFQTIIGDRGTDSELLGNHKALLFSKEKELLAFPVRVHELTPKQKAARDIHAYGEFAFQGAYVYKLNQQEGFVLRGSITHLDPDDLKKAGHDWYDSRKNVERIVYIGDTLYTLSREKVKANDLGTLAERGTLRLSK